MRRRARGFTLLELMVVVAIIGILVAFAVPAYRDSVRKTRRAVAETCLTEYAQYMERFYTTNLAYDQTRDGVAVPAPGPCTQGVGEFYTLGHAAGSPTASTYRVQATPKGDQADDTCGTLGLSNTGVRTPATPGCWQ
jgi:type IV pilus assembly protein PilE